MIKLLKSKRAETLLEAVLSILIFAIVVLGVATMTAVSQNIAKATASDIEQFDDYVGVANGVSGTTSPLPSSSTGSVSFSYELNGATASQITAEVTWIDGRLVTFEAATP